MRNRQHRGGRCRTRQTEAGTWGILLIVAGVIFLLHQIPLTRQLFPHWLFTWPMILVAVGVFSGIRSGFKGAGWLIVLAVGVLFLIHRQSWLIFSLRPYFWPLALIVLGLIIYFKRSSGSAPHQRTATADPAINEVANPIQIADTPPSAVYEEWLDVNVLFSHAERRINTKNFKGGQISAIFGGADINLCHSDIQGVVILNISALFGGIEIVLPSNWQVKNEVSVILGGLDDRRLPQAGLPSGDGKVLVIKGSVIFGGVELKNY